MQSRISAAEFDEGAVPVEKRVRVGSLGGDVDGGVVGADGEPGVGVCAEGGSGRQAEPTA